VRRKSCRRRANQSARDQEPLCSHPAWAVPGVCLAGRWHPSTVNAADSSFTPDGIRAQRFCGIPPPQHGDHWKQPDLQGQILCTLAPTSRTTPACAIPERQRLLQLGTHRFKRRQQTVPYAPCRNLPDFVRLLTRLLKQICLTKDQ